MKRILSIFIATAALLATSIDADARRFGGGRTFGKQRPAPTLREAPKPQQATPPQQQAAQPGQAAQPAAAAGAAGTAAAAKTGFMGRWGGLLAGLGIGALLASVFGAQLGPIIGLLLMGLLLAGVVFLLMRLMSARAAPAARPADGRRVQFAGIGSAVPGAGGGHAAPLAVERDLSPAVPADFDTAAFERVAKTSFLRLQAANDARDLKDIRDFTTPEMYAELAMQVHERGEAPQRTEVLSLESKVIEVAREDGYEIASVRFWGVVRESDDSGPQPFDETWHVQKALGDRRAPWLIAGIQQND